MGCSGAVFLVGAMAEPLATSVCYSQAGSPVQQLCALPLGIHALNLCFDHGGCFNMVADLSNPRLATPRYSPIRWWCGVYSDLNSKLLPHRHSSAQLHAPKYMYVPTRSVAMAFQLALPPSVSRRLRFSRTPAAALRIAPASQPLQHPIAAAIRSPQLSSTSFTHLHYMPHVTVCNTTPQHRIRICLIHASNIFSVSADSHFDAVPSLQRAPASTTNHQKPHTLLHLRHINLLSTCRRLSTAVAPMQVLLLLRMALLHSISSAYSYVSCQVNQRNQPGSPHTAVPLPNP
ncbi:uncharacterized protein J3D65DRAFT_633294 [Phyllosticta citribraziliensis]|uniref:Uncharacterized protein n=1 Tax=Phyllosticta citribraziliensis TaxID=989973 RepID=A0ABR1LGM9_9PEZI